MARVHSLCLCRTAVLLVCCASAQVIASSSSRAALVASNEGFHVHHVMAERHLVQQQQQPEEETDATAAAALAEDVYGSITIVRSAGELLAAVSAGAEHIEIQEHMSLAVLLVNPSFLIRPYPSTIKSIRGNCTGVPPSASAFGLPATDAPLRAFLPHQCLVVSNTGFPRFLSNMWLDNLYIRYGSPLVQESRLRQFIAVGGGGVEMWLTRVTMQGNGDGTRICESCGVDVLNEAALYAEDCLFADFGGSRVVRAFTGGSASLVRCTLANNSMFPSNSGAALIEADGDDMHGSSEVRLEDCSFTGPPSALPTLLADNREGTSTQGVFYSDSPSQTVCVYEGPDDEGAPPNCTTSAPLPLSDAGGRFLTSSNSWFQEQQQVLPVISGDFASPPQAAAQEVGRAAKVELGGGFPVRAVTGSVVGIVLALLLALAGLLLYRRRRMHARREVRSMETAELIGFESKQCVGTDTAEQSTSAPSQPTGTQGSTPGLQGSSEPAAVKEASGSPNVLYESVPVSTLGTTMHTDQLTAVEPPGEGAGDEARKEFLKYQLDTLKGVDVLGGLVFQEGQAVVQMATHKHNRQESALKFFLSTTAFHQEVQQYTDGANPLRQFLPHCRDIIHNDDGRLVDGNGRPLPPCIVMEKGESLDRWVQRNNRDMDQFTCMQIIHHMCECLMDLHSAGYVHRDLKPANIMWLPSQNRWTLIDFGCAASIGAEARTGFTLAYAAPEAVRARYRDDEHTITATEALDAWSVGVLAVELFTGRPALVQFQEGREKIVAKIVGEEELPWEGEGRAKQLLKRAGRYKDAVLGLLCRDPQQRTSVQTFVQQYASILSTTTQQTDSPSPPAPHHSERPAGLPQPKASEIVPTAHTL